MKRIILFFYLFVLPLSFLFSYEGLSYTKYESLSLHVLDVDPHCFEIKPVRALDTGLGRESALSIAERHKAVAAINGGFFQIGGTLDGRACGALKINDWIALPFKPRGCIGWSKENQTPLFDRLSVKIKCEGQSLNGFNRQRKESEAILYTPIFSKTTLTDPHGEEVIIEKGTVQDIVHEQGSTPIPIDGAVLSIHNTSPLYNRFKEGQSVHFQLKIIPQTELTQRQDWENLPYIVGGTPLLVSNGKKIEDFDKEQTIPSFITNRHSRTVVGLLPNGHWLFIVVDKLGSSDGMTIDELADLMVHFGCVAALNLDGGGSSTMVYDHAVVNSPHGDEDEGQGQMMVRRVSDAIIIIPK